MPDRSPYPYLQRRKLKALRSQESCPGPSTKKQKGNNGLESAQRPSEVERQDYTKQLRVARKDGRLEDTDVITSM